MVQAEGRRQYQTLGSPSPLVLPLKPVGMFPFYFNLNKTANHR